MFAIVLRYIKPIETIDALRPAHLEFLDRYYAKDIFIASGRQVPLTGGLILARGCTRDELERIIAEDPFHKEQVATFEIIEFSPNKFHPSLKELVA